MAVARYHLVFEGFNKDVNKTEIGFSLKADMNLSDAQVADLMAGRRTVLANNLPKEKAMALGKRLTQQGLKIKAQALAVNQKNNPEDLRRHLLEGGLDQYFASRFKHPTEEVETIASLAILASFAILTYLILPFVGLLLIRPLISLAVWGDQLVSAFIQLAFGLLMFAPAIWLWPKPNKVEGIDFDSDTEELFVTLTQKISVYMSAPDIKRIVLVESPVLVVHQTPFQWMRNQATLEVGLPVLEALNLQQFVGLLAMRMTPMSSKLYSRLWGVFMQWYNALRLQYKPWALLLNSWVLPMYDHQNDRAQNIARQLVGFQETQRLQRIERRFLQLSRDWPEFVEYCNQLRVRGTNWSQLVAKEARSEKQEDTEQAAFRMESPAMWALSTSEGYQKVFQRKDGGPLFEMPGLLLWQNFQRYVPHAEHYAEKLLKPEALVPPVEAPKKRGNINSIRLNKQAGDVLATQRLMIENALNMHEKPKKPKDVNKLIAKWRATSASFWPDGFLNHKLFPLAKTLFLTLQTLQQIELWQVEDKKLDSTKLPVRDKQIKTLHSKWLEQIARLPAMPLISGAGSKLSEQLQRTAGKKALEELTCSDIQAHNRYWQEFMIIYWVFISGQILTPEIDNSDAPE